MQTCNRLFYLALYLLVVHLNAYAFLLRGVLAALLVLDVIYVHLVLLDTFAFAFLTTALCSAACLLALLTFFLLLLLGLLTRMSSLIQRIQVNLAHHLRLVLQYRFSEREYLGFLGFGLWLFRLGLRSSILSSLFSFFGLCFSSLFGSSLFRLTACLFFRFALCSESCCFLFGFSCSLSSTLRFLGSLAGSLFGGFLRSLGSLLSSLTRSFRRTTVSLLLGRVQSEHFLNIAFLALLLLALGLQFESQVLAELLGKFHIYIVINTEVRIRINVHTMFA